MRFTPNEYRTHLCNQIRKIDKDKNVIISGWLQSKRDHGGLIFADIRDHYGITQIVIDSSKTPVTPEELDSIPNESAITVHGTVQTRKAGTEREDLETGEIEILVQRIVVHSRAHNLPIQILEDKNCNDINEAVRLKYRFLDLRRQEMHHIVNTRSEVLKWVRDKMFAMGFVEVQTPILTASSPEGAKDFLVPSRMHPTKFYALPQAPQQFKQLLMMSGFDKYFQIAPCFRNEDSRSDRTPGEFYQIDLEMSFSTQEDILNTMEPVIFELFSKFGCKQVADLKGFPRITYEESLLKYGTDKPDLRNPLVNSDVTQIFNTSNFSIFLNQIAKGAVVRAIQAPNTDSKPRSFFDNMIAFAQENGAKGLAYITFDKDGNGKGPIAKLLTEQNLNLLKLATGIKNCDSLFFSCAKEEEANRVASIVRNKLGKELNLTENTSYRFCWVYDFPYFELDDKAKITFSHNPFSMPQCSIQDMENKTPQELLKIKALQYDLVCNGVEISSGAIRNHSLELLYQAFKISGYNKEEVDTKFPGITSGLRFGPPPHGGMAPGFDRIIMLLLDKQSIRDVITFPLNGKGEDLLMNAPSEVDQKDLIELKIKTIT